MGNVPSKLKVIVTYGETTVEFDGSPNTVLVSINNFLSKQIPAIDIANRITVSYSISDLIDLFEDYIKITPEGSRVWKINKKISDKFVIGLQLVAAKISHESGKLLSSMLSLGDLESSTGLKSKSISSRLSEMVRPGYVEKDTGENGVKYGITTQGVYWLSESLTKIPGSK